MKIAIDLDGTICAIRQPDEKYEDLLPLPGAVEKITALKASGFYIIILTARNMETCQGNIGKVIKNVGKVTLDWLARYEIPYDEIFFGKPNAEIYIDDRGLRFTTWGEINEQLIKGNAKTK